MNEQQLSAAAAALGRRGGQAKSRRKTAAVRLNARKGGWPKGRPRKPKNIVVKSGQTVRLKAGGIYGSIVVEDGGTLIGPVVSDDRDQPRVERLSIAKFAKVDAPRIAAATVHLMQPPASVRGSDQTPPPTPRG